MTLIAEGPPKYCPQCGFKRPRSDFYAFRRGDAIYAQTLCKAHANAARVNDAKDNVQARREARRRYRRKRRMDPERHAIDLDYRREWYRRTRGVAPEDYRTSRAGRTQDRVPVGPFAEWLWSVIERDGCSIAGLAKRLGIADRMFRLIVNREQLNVELDTVERALFADDTITLRDLYPEIYAEAA